MKRLLIFLALLAAVPFVAAQSSIPLSVPFQGRLLESGANYTGNGFFKFALIATFPAPDRTIWSNDNTGVNGGEPVTSETIPVTDGYYSVQLGGSNPAMTQVLPDVLASIHGPAVRLRVWFSKTAAGPFQQFSPDFVVGSTPYAHSAGLFGGRTSFEYLLESELDDLRGNLDLLFAESIRILDGASGDRAASLQIHGALGRWEIAATPTVTIRKDGTGGSNDLAGASAVAVLGSSSGLGFDGVAVASTTDDSITVFDRNTMTQLYVIKDGLNGVNRLNNVTDVAVVRTLNANRVWIAAVAPFDDGITLFELTPTGFSILAEAGDNIGGFNALDTTHRIAVDPDARIIAVTAANESAVQIMTFDSTTGALSPAAELRDGIGGFDLLDGVSGVAIERLRGAGGPGRTILVIAASTDASVTVVDITNPQAPVLTDTISNTFNLSAPIAIAMHGEMVAVASAADNGIRLFTCTPSGDITTVNGSLISDTSAFPGLAGVNRLSLAGTLLIASASTDQTVSLIDIGIPSSPRLAGSWSDGTAPFTEILGPAGVAWHSLDNASGEHNVIPVSLEIYLTGVSDAAVTKVAAAALLRPVSIFTTGRIGLGTEIPAADFEIQDLSTVASLRDVSDGDANATLRLGTHDLGLAVVQMGEYNNEVFSGWNYGYNGSTGSLTWGHEGFAQTPGTRFTLERNGNATLTGTLTQGSDRARKENIVPADSAAILEKVAALPVAEWSYTGDGGTRHIGPMSQDFRAAFGLGDTDKGIAAVDADGVALAAIKALKTELDALKQDNAALRARVEQLEAK